MTAASIIGTLLAANIAGGLAIIAVLALRGGVRRLAGARIAYMAWLIVPAAIAASFLPARVVTTVRSPAAVSSVSDAPAMRPAEPAVGGPVAGLRMPADPATITGTPAASASSAIEPVVRSAAPIDWVMLAAIAWIVGAILALGSLTFRQARALRSIGTLSRVSPNAFRAARSVVGPAVVGVISPRIVLPADFEAVFDASEQKVVMAHEEAHVSGRLPRRRRTWRSFHRA